MEKTFLVLPIFLVFSLSFTSSKDKEYKYSEESHMHEPGEEENNKKGERIAKDANVESTPNN